MPNSEEIKTLRKIAINQNYPIHILFDNEGNSVTLKTLKRKISRSIGEDVLTEYLQGLTASLGMTALLPVLLKGISIVYNKAEEDTPLSNMTQGIYNSRSDTFIQLLQLFNFKKKHTLNKNVKDDLKVKGVTTESKTRIGTILDVSCLVGLFFLFLFAMDTHRELETKSDKVTNYSDHSYSGTFKRDPKLKHFHTVFDVFKNERTPPDKDFYNNVVQLQTLHFKDRSVRDIRPIHLFRPDGTARASLGEIVKFNL